MSRRVILHVNSHTPFLNLLVDLSQIPFLGERVIELSKLLPNARAGDSEMSIPPLFLPKAPERNYFLFGEVTMDSPSLMLYICTFFLSGHLICNIHIEIPLKLIQIIELYTSTH